MVKKGGGGQTLKYVAELFKEEKKFFRFCLKEFWKQNMLLSTF